MTTQVEKRWGLRSPPYMYEYLPSQQRTRYRTLSIQRTNPTRQTFFSKARVTETHEKGHQEKSCNSIDLGISTFNSAAHASSPTLPLPPTWLHRPDRARKYTFATPCSANRALDQCQHRDQNHEFTFQAQGGKKKNNILVCFPSSSTSPVT